MGGVDSLLSQGVLATSPARDPGCVPQDGFNVNGTYDDVPFMGGDPLAMRYTAPGPLTTNRLEVFTGEAEGVTEVAFPLAIST